MAENYLITGYWGEPHVTAENDRGINAAIFGTGRFVLPVGEQFRAEYIGNNTVRMYDGKLLDNGAAAGIPAGKYIDVLISEAGQGMKRNDIIIFQYSQDVSTLIESGVFTVLKGTETSGTPIDPELTQDNILSDDATFDQFALWRVSVSGAVISSPVRLFDVYDNVRNAGHGIATSGNGSAYTATVDSIKSLTAGESFIMIPHVSSTTVTPTLNVNGFGAKTIRQRLSTNSAIAVPFAESDFLSSGKPVTVTYNGTYWVVEIARPDGNNIYGTVPIKSGGTGATTAEQARVNLGIETADGTVTSGNADYAEVGEWADGNKNSEDRIGYFVCVDTDNPGIIMKKATSDNDVRGVTVDAPAFSGNCSSDKFDSNGELLPKYNFVAVMGIVPVIDNGTCTIGGRCMPASDSTAQPVTGDYGYQVLERIDDTHILVAIEPGADAQYRFKNYVDSKRKKITATISADWVGDSAPYTQVVSADGVTSDDTPHITPIYSSDNATALSQKEAWSAISHATTAENAITFTCFEEKPNTAIQVQIEVIR